MYGETLKFATSGLAKLWFFKFP